MKVPKGIPIILGGLLLSCVTAASARGSLTLAFAPDRSTEAGGAGVYGCHNDAGPAQGMLEPDSLFGRCHSGKFGAAGGDRIASPAEFTSPPFSGGLSLRGPAYLAVIARSVEDSYTAADVGSLEYELHEIQSDGSEVLISSGTAVERFSADGGHESFDVGPHMLAPGSRLRLRLGIAGPADGPASTTARSDLVFGGTDAGGTNDYSESGITFAVESDGGGTFAGSLPLALLGALLGACALRRRLTRQPLWSVVALALACGPAHAGTVFLAFTPNPATDSADGGAVSPEGCFSESGLARGKLNASAAGTTCHSGAWGEVGQFGAGAGNVWVESPETPSDGAQFDSDPLPAAFRLGGPAGLVVYYMAANDGTTADADPGYWPRLYYKVLDVQPGTPETSTVITSGSGFNLNPEGAGRVYRGVESFSIPEYTVPAGNILRVALTSTLSPDGRVLFGDQPVAVNPAPTPGARDSYADAGITIATPTPNGDSQLGGGGDPGGSKSGGSAGGALAPVLLLALLAGVVLRAHRRSKTV